MVPLLQVLHARVPARGWTNPVAFSWSPGVIKLHCLQPQDQHAIGRWLELVDFNHAGREAAVSSGTCWFLHLHYKNTELSMTGSGSRRELAH
jgi:hypothetical protein